MTAFTEDTPLNDGKLLTLVANVLQVSPQLVDHWQAVAIIESLGYTDHIIQVEFGFPDALALGRYVYQQYNASVQTPSVLPIQPNSQNGLMELRIFFTEFSRSFVYAVPLIVVLLLEYLPIQQTARFFPPDLAALLTLATILSLITSGGFVQMIKRRAAFYFEMGEMAQMRRTCLIFLRLGILTSILLSLLSIWFGFYQSVFADQYLVLANVYYLALSLLWMLFAVLSVLIPWGTLVALIGLTLVFLIFRVLLGVGALEAQIVAMGFTLLAIASVIAMQFRRIPTPSAATVTLPRLSASVYLLAPYFGYGVLYFAFLFTDRVVAGLAINPALGLTFAIDSAYQKSMDLSLLNFLLLVPLVEYLSYSFIRYWYKTAKVTPLRSMAKFSIRLRWRYGLIVIATAIFFSLLVLGSLVILPLSHWSSLEVSQTLLGSVGYLLFSIGLLNAITLFSLNQITRVLQPLVLALVLNFGVGYLAASLATVAYAVAGLIVGAIVFAAMSSWSVLQSIGQPDYMYYRGGYDC